MGVWIYEVKQELRKRVSHIKFFRRKHNFVYTSYILYSEETWQDEEYEA